MTPRQWLISKSYLYIIDHNLCQSSDFLSDLQIWEIVESRARWAYSQKLNKQSAIWDYYLATSDKSAKRIIADVRKELKRREGMIRDINLRKAAGEKR